MELVTNERRIWKVIYDEPSHLPEFRELLYLAGARPRDVARHLGVTERTVYGWQARNAAPRAVMLALYWSSQGGRHELHTDLVNECALYYRKAVGAALEADRLRAALAVFERHAAYDSANAPVYRAG